MPPEDRVVARQNGRVASVPARQGFGLLVEEVEARPGYRRPLAFGLGVATTVEDKVLDVRFLTINVRENFGTAAVLARHLGELSTGHRFLDGATIEAVLDDLSVFRGETGHTNVQALEQLAHLPRPHVFAGHDLRAVAAVVMDADDPPSTAGDVYLRLHLLSLRHLPPRSINLEGAFAKLNTNVWTTDGVLDQACFAELQRERILEGRPLVVLLQDKFPRMLDYVSPPGVRILNPNNVRLGAHLAVGTVVMTAGAVNFNAGTLGEAMIEGRISSGVVVGARSDIGGGASLMGTLSGGNKAQVTVGEDCLVEAMAGLGIPVGDRVRIEAGFYVKSTTPILVVDSPHWSGNLVASRHVGHVVKAIALAGISDAVFRRNANNGTPEVVPRGGRVWGQLNADLHSN